MHPLQSPLFSLIFAKYQSFFVHLVYTEPRYEGALPYKDYRIPPNLVESLSVSLALCVYLSVCVSLTLSLSLCLFPGIFGSAYPVVIS